MDVVVAGGHGKVALRLLRLLAARGDRARGLIRSPEQAADLEAAGAEPVLCDLEREPAYDEFIAGADAVVFAAGAGPGSGPERKRTVDYGAAVKLIESAERLQIRRYVMVSAMGVPRPETWADAMVPYYSAKAEADRALEASRLDPTIVRPGRLTDEPGTGRVEVAPLLDHRGAIPRDDVAAVLLAVLDTPGTIRKSFDVISGEVPIADAVGSL